jgi:hypothetical protein
VLLIIIVESYPRFYDVYSIIDHVFNAADRRAHKKAPAEAHQHPSPCGSGLGIAVMTT